MNTLARLSQSDTRARFTSAEFLRMLEAGAFTDMKVELIEGELERMNPPMSGHGARQAMVIGLLWSVARNADLHIVGETGIVLDDETVVACDAALLKEAGDERSLLVPEQLLLVVEVAETTLARDLGLKRTLYAAAGIPLYWVIDAARQVTHVYAEPVDGDYAAVVTVRFNEPLAVPETDATILLGRDRT